MVSKGIVKIRNPEKSEPYIGLAKWFEFHKQFVAKELPGW
jgi:hypothetical protein